LYQVSGASVHEQMRQMIVEEVTVDSFKKLLLSFYDSQKEMPFGNLAAMHFEMFGGPSELVEKVAAIVQFIILAGDMLDDLQDNDKPMAPWSQIEKGEAINASVAMLQIGFSQLMKLPLPEQDKSLAIEYTNTLLLESLGGQYVDLLNQFETEEECLKSIEQKSGCLVAAACLIGMLLAGGDEYDIVGRYGKYIGVAAQIKNDVSGLYKLNEGNDILHRKRTIPTLYILNMNNEKGRFLQDYYHHRLNQAEFLAKEKEIQEIILSSGCLQYSKALVQIFVMRALEEVKQLAVQDLWKSRITEYIQESLGYLTVNDHTTANTAISISENTKQIGDFICK